MKTKERNDLIDTLIASGDFCQYCMEKLEKQKI